MRSNLVLRSVLLVVIGLLAIVAPVLAHSGEGKAGIQVEPPSVTAGQTVVLAGSGLEPNQDRVIVLAGADILVQFGTVKTDGEGMFQMQLTIPSHLPSGNYEVRAIGDETLTTALDVTAAAGVAPSAPADGATEFVPARNLPASELGLILVAVAVAGAAGVVLIAKAEHVGRTTVG